MKRTECYACFVVESAGTYQEPLGFVAAQNSDFDPDDLTRILKAKPFRVRRMGAPRRSGHGLYPYSKWYGFRQDKPDWDAAEQCARIVQGMRPLIPALQAFRENFNVEFTLLIVVRIGNGVVPVLHFNREVIEFCSETGTEIGINLQVYDEDD